MTREPTRPISGEKLAEFDADAHDHNLWMETRMGKITAERDKLAEKLREQIQITARIASENACNQVALREAEAANFRAAGRILTLECSVSNASEERDRLAAELAEKASLEEQNLNLLATCGENTAARKRLEGENSALKLALEAHTLCGRDPRFIELKAGRHRIAELEGENEMLWKVAETAYRSYDNGVHAPGCFSRKSSEGCKCSKDELGEALAALPERKP